MAELAKGIVRRAGSKAPGVERRAIRLAQLKMPK